MIKDLLETSYPITREEVRQRHVLLLDDVVPNPCRYFDPKTSHDYKHCVNDFLWEVRLKINSGGNYRRF